MTSHSLRYLANCSMLFTEVPLLERPAAAKAAGFDAVEFWWPWPDQPVPGDADVDAFVTAVAGRRRAARRAQLLRRRPRRAATAACSPSRAARSSSGTTSRSPSASASGWACKAFNALYGNRVDDATPGQQDDLGAENLAYAAEGRRPHRRHRAGRAGERSEALPAAHRRRRGRAWWTGSGPRGTANVGFLCDLFHLANNGDDVDAAIADHADRGSPTSRSPTPPAAASPAPATCRSTAGSAELERPATPATSASSTSRPTTTVDSLAWLPGRRAR